MYSGFQVDLEVMSLIGQLAERQAEHLRAIRSYLDGYTTLSDVGGVIMLYLSDRYNEGRQNAREGFDQGVAICDAVADAADDTRQAYMDADSQAVEAFRALGQQFGISIASYQEPSEPTLGMGTGSGAGGDWNVSEGIVAWESGVSEGVGGLIDGADSFASTASEFAYRDDGSGFDDISVSHLASLGVDRLVDKAWDAVDRVFGDPYSTSTLRDRVEQLQIRRYAQGYDAGSNSTEMGWMTSDSDWASGRTTERTINAGSRVYSAVGDVQSAWNAVEEAQDAVARHSAVSDVAEVSNTDNIDWAQ